MNKTPFSRKRTEEKDPKKTITNKEILGNTVNNNNNVNNSVLSKNFSTKNLNIKTDVSRNCTPGKIRPLNLNGKTPIKNINNTPISKKISNDDNNNISITNTRESKIYNDNNNTLKNFDSKKSVNSNIQNLKDKSQGKIKYSIPSGNGVGGLGNEIKNKINKKFNEKLSKEQNNNSNIFEPDINNNNNYNNYSNNNNNFNNNNNNNKRIKNFRYTPSDLLDVEKELNVSNIMQLESDITDDLLLYNKEDQFLNSAFNKNNIKVDDDYMNEIQTFNNKNFCNNLESEEILDDKWDDIIQFVSIREIALLSLTNKKIGKNAILELIQELEKEKNYFEEKVLAAVKKN